MALFVKRALQGRDSALQAFLTIADHYPICLTKLFARCSSKPTRHNAGPPQGTAVSVAAAGVLGDSRVAIRAKRHSLA
jgi:hypothetical protein